MALNLVAYDSSDNDSHGEEEEEQQDNSSQVIVLPKPSQQPETPSRQAEDVGDIPRPSEKELELAEQVRIEKENLATLAKQEQLARLTRKKNGRVVIGIPSIAEVGFKQSVLVDVDFFTDFMVLRLSSNIDFKLTYFYW